LYALDFGIKATPRSQNPLSIKSFSQRVKNGLRQRLAGEFRKLSSQQIGFVILDTYCHLISF